MRLTGLWWWIDRWRKSSAYVDMTLSEQGAYRNLLDEAWLRGGAIPNDENVLAKSCGDPRQWRKVRAKVIERFWLSEEGWRNETLDEIMNESTARAAKQKRYRQGRNAPSVQAILARDGAVCGICAFAVDPDEAEIDHIIPTSRGGDAEHADNLQLAHPKCNCKKGARSSARHSSLPHVRGRLQSNAQGNAQRESDDLSDSDPDSELKSSATETGRNGSRASVDRVRRFIDNYRDRHEEYCGVAYLGNPQTDYREACALVEAFDDAMLDKLTVYWLNDQDKFARDGTRTIAKMRSRASKYAEELKAKRLA